MQFDLNVFGMTHGAIEQGGNSPGMVAEPVKWVSCICWAVLLLRRVMQVSDSSM